MVAHLDKDSPNDDSKEEWMEENAHFFLQICNSIDNEVIDFVKCEKKIILFFIE